MVAPAAPAETSPLLDPPTIATLVDNASTTETRGRVGTEVSGLEVIRLPENRGFAGGNNHGIGLASDVEWIALLNPDAFPEPRWLEELLLAAQRHPKAGAFGSVLLDAGDPAHLDGTGMALTDAVTFQVNP